MVSDTFIAPTLAVHFNCHDLQVVGKIKKVQGFSRNTIVHSVFVC